MAEHVCGFGDRQRRYLAMSEGCGGARIVSRKGF